MARSTRAGIELSGSVLRYAAVTRSNGAFELQRLGRCDFEFDAARLLQAEEADETALEDVSGALRDVFKGLGVGHLYVALPPSCGIQFFAPVDRSATPTERNETLHWQATQLRTDEAGPFKMVVCNLDDVGGSERDEQAEWHHVIAVDRSVQERFTRIAGVVDPDVRPRFRGTILAGYEVGTRIVAREGGAEEEGPTHELLVGAYRDRCEITLSQNGRWTAATVADGSDADESVYQAARLLEEVGLEPDVLDRLYTYGSAAEELAEGRFGEIFVDREERLDPFQAINIEAQSVSEDFAHWEYVPSLGVTL